MRRIFILLALTLCCISSGAQVKLRFNALGWGAAIPNVGIEAGLTRHITFVAEGYYSPFWNLNGFKLRGWMVTPELRYYFCHSFAAHYIALHGNYTDYSEQQFYGGQNIRDGRAYGAGLTYGYVWRMSRKWSFDLFAGAGWWHRDNNTYCHCDPTYQVEKNASENFFGLTRAGATFAYSF